MAAACRASVMPCTSRPCRQAWDVIRMLMDGLGYAGSHEAACWQAACTAGPVTECLTPTAAIIHPGSMWAAGRACHRRQHPFAAMYALPLQSAHCVIYGVDFSRQAVVPACSVETSRPSVSTGTSVPTSSPVSAGVITAAASVLTVVMHLPHERSTRQARVRTLRDAGLPAAQGSQSAPWHAVD